MITFRDIGVSNFTVNHLTKLLKDPKVTIVPAVNQVYMCISLIVVLQTDRRTGVVIGKLRLH